MQTFIYLQLYYFNANKLDTHFPREEPERFEVELESLWNTLDPSFYRRWSGYRIITSVTLHTRENSGIMQ